MIHLLKIELVKFYVNEYVKILKIFVQKYGSKCQ